MRAGKLRVAIHAVILAVAAAAVCSTRAGTGSGHGCAGHAAAGHPCAGHPMGPPGHHGGGIAIRGCGGSYSDVSYMERGGAVDRELHERTVKTERAKDEFRRTHPCPEGDSTSGACPGFEIACVNPDPGNPERCFDSSNLEWRAVRPSTP